MDKQEKRKEIALKKLIKVFAYIHCELNFSWEEVQQLEKDAHIKMDKEGY